MARIPKYQQVSQDLKEKIFQNIYAIDSLIPSESELERIYDVSKMTVRQAVELLVNEGFLEKRSGVGTRVISNRMFNKLSKADSFSALLQNKGLRVEKKILEIGTIAVKQLPIAVSSAFEKCTYVRRLYLVNGIPYIYFVHYLPQTDQVVPFQHLDKQSLYVVLRNLGMTIDEFQDAMAGYLLQPADQEILSTQDTVGLLRTRRSLDPNGRLIEYSVGKYLTNRQPYQMHLEI